jgi:ParB family chromosome partitioning protein
LALIENIQRENLNAIDEALAYQRLADEFSLTQDQIAVSVGKDRSTVANFMRLLKLPEEVRAELAAGTLSMGHARALLGLGDAAEQRHAAREVISRGLSVRDTESLVKKLAAARATGTVNPNENPNPNSVFPNPEPGTRNPELNKDVHTKAAEDRMRFALGTKVRIVRQGASGAIEIDFGSESELNRIYEHITRS